MNDRKVHYWDGERQVTYSIGVDPAALGEDRTVVQVVRSETDVLCDSVQRWMDDCYGAGY